MKILFAGFLSFLPFFAVASDSDGGVIAAFFFMGILLLSILFWIGSSVYEYISKRAIAGVQKDMQALRDKCDREIDYQIAKCDKDMQALRDKCDRVIDYQIAKCDKEKADCAKMYQKLEKALRESIGKQSKQLQEKYKFRQSLLRMQEICLQHGGIPFIEDCKKIDRYFVQIKNRQEFLAKWEQDLQDKDVLLQREIALSEKIRNFEVDRENFQQERKNLEIIKTAIKEACECKKNSYPPLAEAIADFCVRRQSAYEEYLRTKPHKALKQASILSETKLQLKVYIQKYNEVKYLLNAYEKLFPWIEEFREYSIDDVEKPPTQIEFLDNQDVVKNYLSPAEYEKLAPVERNQKALDRYLEGHKSKVQIGRLYERFVGYQYEQKGYNIKYFGATEGVEDLGRDLIARKGNEVIIIQCKYWSKEKTIRENVICQLYGTTLKYRIEHKGQRYRVSGALVTSTKCSDIAREFAEELGIDLVENYTYKDYPMIKCNIGKNGEKIYHLPFDQMYDKVKIETQKGEMYAMTCFEAELNGFRRAFKWRGENGTA